MPRVITLVQEGCGACEEAKEFLAPLIQSGQVEIMDVTNDPEAILLAAAHDIIAFPTALIMMDDGQVFGMVCDIAPPDDFDDDESDSD